MKLWESDFKNHVKDLPKLGPILITKMITKIQTFGLTLRLVPGIKIFSVVEILFQKVAKVRF